MFDLTGIADTGKQLNESFKEIIKLLTEIRDTQREALNYALLVPQHNFPNEDESHV